MKSLLSRFKEGLRKTTPTFYKAFSAVGGLFGSAKLDEQRLELLEEALYGADFGVETCDEIIAEIQQAFRKNKDLRGLDAANIGATVLRRVLAGAEGRWSPQPGKPAVVALIGVNGSGKTTTTAKLGKLWQDAGHKVVLGACDTFRAAANEQLKSWADRLDLELIASQHGADAAAVAYDAYSAAEHRAADILLLDTAGRLHNKTNLMQELKKNQTGFAKARPKCPTSLLARGRWQHRQQLH